jgi:tetratricopeptide (TPR) repeat protein
MRAGERAVSLAAHLEALRYFEQAAELADDDAVRAGLIERGGMAAQAAGDADGAIGRFERAIELFEAERQTHPAARVSARLGIVMWQRDRIAEAVDRMERSFEVLSAEEPDEDFAALAAELGRLDFFAGRIDSAQERIEVAIDIAEALWIPEVFSNALNTKAIILYSARGTSSGSVSAVAACPGGRARERHPVGGVPGLLQPSGPRRAVGPVSRGA